MGGVWERLIQLVKNILYSVLKEQVLDDEALQTALCEVEAIMNDRPITTVTNDPNDLEPLTPNHLLHLKAKPVLPPGLFQRSDLYSQGDGSKYNISLTSSGRDGSGSIFHLCRSVTIGTKLRETSVLVTFLSPSMTPPQGTPG